MREHGTLHIPDVRAQNDFPTIGFRQRLRALSCSFPFVSREKFVGTLSARRIEVRPFTPVQIKL